MENKLTEQEVAKVFAMYPGVEVDLSETEWFKHEKELRGRFLSAHLIGVNFSGQGGLSAGCAIRHNILTQNNGLQWLSFTAFKLCLTPLFKITDEHKVELLKMSGYTDLEGHSTESNNRQFDHEFRGFFRAGKIHCDMFQQLILWGYSVPLFFGLNHWANGKTAIELGIAIDKTIQ